MKNTDKAVTVLGLGAMGSALARAFIAAGHPTTVWNRAPEKAAALVAAGAARADTAATAVAARPLGGEPAPGEGRGPRRGGRGRARSGPPGRSGEPAGGGLPGRPPLRARGAR